MPSNKMRPIHPGEILREEYLIPLELSVNALAQALRVPATRLHEITNQHHQPTPLYNCRHSITPSPLFWRRCAVLVKFANGL